MWSNKTVEKLWPTKQAKHDIPTNCMLISTITYSTKILL